MLEWLFGKKKQPEPQTQQKKKPPKTQLEQEAEDKWMYDFVVQFLNSPIWRVTILDFVDTKCIVFDNEEENKFQYTTIHNQFKQLVGNLFDGMMSEIGLTEDKLIDILEKGFQSKEKKLFNQLLLCDDFLKFKDLMLRRNKALETEAYNTMSNPDVRKKSKIQKERDLIRSSQVAEQQRLRKLEEEEEEMLRKVLEMSKIQAQERQAIDKLEFEAARQQIENIQRKESETKKQTEKQIEQPEEKQEKKDEEEENFEPKSRVNRHKKLNPIGGGGKKSDLPPLKGVHKNIEENSQTKNQQEQKKQQIKQQTKRQEVKQEKTAEQPSKVESQEDRKKRLMEQRERIKKKKEEQRRRMMEEEESQNTHEVTNIVLQDDGIHESRVVQKHQEQQEKVSQEELQRRKAIMKRIRNRIVDDF